MSVILPVQLLSAHLVLLVSYPAVRIVPVAVPVEPSSTSSQEEAMPVSPWVASNSRRIFDCAVAAIALLLLMPVLAVCWLLVRLSSPGGVFFRQLRMGRDGKEFPLAKFRSMQTGCCDNLPSHTTQNDPRITAVGAFLRRYKLDELPQFWNVLKGDMSLVGTRPKLAQHEPLRLSHRPGLTGQATLAFRNEERMLLEVPTEEVDRFYEEILKPIKAELDIEYMQKATFASDVRILWRTFCSCLHCASDPWKELSSILSRNANSAKANEKWSRMSFTLEMWRTEQGFRRDITEVGFADD